MGPAAADRERGRDGLWDSDTMAFPTPKKAVLQPEEQPTQHPRLKEGLSLRIPPNEGVH